MIKSWTLVVLVGALFLSDAAYGLPYAGRPRGQPCTNVRYVPAYGVTTATPVRIVPAYGCTTGDLQFRYIAIPGRCSTIVLPARLVPAYGITTPAPVRFVPAFGVTSVYR